MTQMQVAEKLAEAIRKVIATYELGDDTVVIRENWDDRGNPAVIVMAGSFEFMPFDNGMEVWYDLRYIKQADWKTPKGFFVENYDSSVILVYKQ